MLIVDAQVHIWTGGIPPKHHRQQPFGAAQLVAEMDAAGVDRAILVPPAWDPAGNAPSLDAAALYPSRFAVMGRIDLALGASPEALRIWRTQPGMLGVRLAFNNAETRSRLIDRSTEWFWTAAEEQNLPVMLLVPGLLPLIAEMAHRHPKLKIVVDHLAIPRGARGSAAFEHLPELLAISRYENVAVKAAGLPSYAAGEDFPYPSLHGPIRQIIGAFGANRVFWGTDLSRMPVSYRTCVEMMTKGLPWLEPDDLEEMMGAGICRWIGWH